MNYKFKTKPYAHQLTALEKSWNKETFAYFMEMGTGKTKVLIDNLAMLYDKGKVDGAIIGITCSLVSDITNGKYNLLKWDKQERTYYPIAINLHEKGEIDGN